VDYGERAQNDLDEFKRVPERTPCRALRAVQTPTRGALMHDKHEAGVERVSPLLIDCWNLEDGESALRTQSAELVEPRGRAHRLRTRCELKPAPAARLVANSFHVPRVHYCRGWASSTPYWT
jgi:hypothetical protein